jgi:hypothetical protein
VRRWFTDDDADPWYADVLPRLDRFEHGARFEHVRDRVRRWRRTADYCPSGDDRSNRGSQAAFARRESGDRR